MVLWMRRNGQLPLDDLLETAQEVLPHLRRSSLHRLLVRHGCNRLPKKEQQDTGQPGTFKEYGPGYLEYGPGYLHIDCFYLPKLEEQKHYCFVAIDRATRLVYLWVYEHKNKEAATDFLVRCLEFYPFKIEKILTDNGREFTLATFKNRWGSTTTAGAAQPRTNIPLSSCAKSTRLNIVRLSPTRPRPTVWSSALMA